MTTSRAAVDGYRQDLTLALRLRDVQGPRISEVLAELDSHLAETGEDPLEAFGPPKEYARQLVTALDPNRPAGPGRWLLAVQPTDVAIGLLSLTGSVLLAAGMYAVGAGAASTIGLPGVATVGLGLLCLAVGAVLVVRASRDRSDRLVHPRTGDDLLPPAPRWTLAVGVGVPVLMLLGCLALGVASR